MKLTEKYLNGDIDWLKNVNKIIPRKYELPLLLKSKVQIRKNMFGIESRLFHLMESYRDIFRYLEPELKQPIRALQKRSKSHPGCKPIVNLKCNHYALKDTSSWKLPPNIYNFSNLSQVKPSVGKKGPYQCFTVERTEKTVKNNFNGTKLREQYCKTDFYDLKSSFGVRYSNKNKFLKAPRFQTSNKIRNLSPSKHSRDKILPRVQSKSCLNKNFTVVFYYPQTTVPTKEISSLMKSSFETPDPSRYSPRIDISSKSKNISSKKVTKKNQEHFGCNSHDLEKKDIRYNTMIVKRNLFGMKTGRPAAFLSATPRFEDPKEKTLRSFSKSKTCMSPYKSPHVQDVKGNQRKKSFSTKRIEILSSPKNFMEKCSSENESVLVKKIPLTHLITCDESNGAL